VTARQGLTHVGRSREASLCERHRDPDRDMPCVQETVLETFRDTLPETGETPLESALESACKGWVHTLNMTG
jgi:hypothetical protein